MSTFVQTLMKGRGVGVGVAISGVLLQCASGNELSATHHKGRWSAPKYLDSPFELDSVGVLKENSLRILVSSQGINKPYVI